VVTDRLAAWFREQLGKNVTVEERGRAELGHSAETLLLTLVTSRERREVVVRVRPEPPGLLEPYDLERQFTILRAVEPTPVRAPRALWYEPTGDVLGAEFYVMEWLPGSVYERGVPDEIRNDPGLTRRMCEGMVDQIAAVHLSGVDLGGGDEYVARELEHWAAEARRAASLLDVDRLVAALGGCQPPTPRITLVHGDTKPGNFAFVDGEVTGLFDWEMATMGDPFADIGWAEVCWRFPGYFTSLPGAPSADDLVGRWEAATGLRAEHRAWHRAMQALKMAAILLVGGYLFEKGHTNDPRLKEMAGGAKPLLQMGLRELDEVL
jgi:aminoglycoside phosphotransferase (APT) family kinase protein